jgi:hypothetical protein
MRRLSLALMLLIGCASAGIHAQWLNYKVPGVPRTKDGKAKLDAPAPRSADGHPDLTGVWMHEVTTVADVRRLFGSALVDQGLKTGAPGMELGTQHKYGFNILIGFKPEDSPARPETTKQFEDRRKNPPPMDQCDPTTLPFGFPLQGLLSEPIKIVQAPRVTMVLYEAGASFRQIFADGRKLPEEFNLPAYLGYSVGRWEGQTFVVESAGFNDKTTLDAFGHPHSDQLRVVERFRRRDFGHLDVEMTFDDPKYYTRPFTIRVPHDLLADDDIFEMYPENEKDCAHIANTK